ncbi:hypothetical protein EMIT0111MI5_70055 [Burkholderia sp. IT-111MI5]
MSVHGRRYTVPHPLLRCQPAFAAHRTVPIPSQSSEAGSASRYPVWYPWSMIYVNFASDLMNTFTADPTVVNK